jgi:hypothetical protein
MYIVEGPKPKEPVYHGKCIECKSAVQAMDFETKTIWKAGIWRGKESLHSARKYVVCPVCNERGSSNIIYVKELSWLARLFK